MASQDYEPFIRWQGITRDQLGTTSNLFLGLATGLIAFDSALLLQHKSAISSCAVGLGLVGCVLLAFSVALALWCATNRLKDFRLTAKIANPKHSGSVAILDEWREESTRLGDLTWKIFRGQLWCFALGAGGVTVSSIIYILS